MNEAKRTERVNPLPEEVAGGQPTVAASAGRVEAIICALNAVVGDYLRDRGNGLALSMELRHRSAPLSCDREGIGRAYPAATGKICVLVHGLGHDERTWSYPGEREISYGSLLQGDLGYTPFYVRYNTGLHISENGESLAELIEALVRSHPVAVEEIVLLGHSMGGLVLRSACHVGMLRGDPWANRVKRVFYIGSPHLGAPLEKLGNIVAWALRAVGISHTDLVADVINLRSSGVKDLRFANLVRQDWEGFDPDALLENRRTAVPLLPGATHHLLVGTLGGSERHLVTALFGDSMVRVSSAAGRCSDDSIIPALPQNNVRIFPGVTHGALAHDPGVYMEIKTWCAADAREEVAG